MIQYSRFDWILCIPCDGATRLADPGWPVFNEFEITGKGDDIFPSSLLSSLMTVSFLRVCVAGSPLLLFYVIKAFFQARAIWAQFRLAPSCFSSHIDFSNPHFLRFTINQRGTWTTHSHQRILDARKAHRRGEIHHARLGQGLDGQTQRYRHTLLFFVYQFSGNPRV